MKKIVRWLCVPAAVGFLSLACAVAAGEEELVLADAWIRAMPPGMKMTAGFGQLRNPGSEAVKLTEFTSPQFGDVSLHRTELEDGVSRMREIPSLVIEPALLGSGENPQPILKALEDLLTTLLKDDRHEPHPVRADR